MATSQKLVMPEDIRKQLIKKHYAIVGNHSAIQICSWTKKAIKGQGVCYKEQFYGIDCHRCAQISPAAVWCPNNCIYCWRPMEFMKYKEMTPEMVDPPDEIIEGIIEARKKLLSGLHAHKDLDPNRWPEALEPNHFAISLSGEPTMYPRLDEMIHLLRKRESMKSIFIVTNGQFPEALEKLMKNDALPTQLYLSMNAPDRELFHKINNPVLPDAWERFHKTLELMSKMKTRRVIRITLIKGYNDKEEYIPGYAEQIRKSNADFIEVKAYMYLGYSMRRLSAENMPKHEEVKAFGDKLAKYLGYEYVDEAVRSRIVLHRNPESVYPLKITSVIAQPIK